MPEPEGGAVNAAGGAFGGGWATGEGTLWDLEFRQAVPTFRLF